MDSFKFRLNLLIFLFHTKPYSFTLPGLVDISRWDFNIEYTFYKPAKSYLQIEKISKLITIRRIDPL